MNERISQNSIESNVIGDTVDDIIPFIELLKHSDSILVVIPKIVFEEQLGVSAFFRFSYDRFSYGRFGDVGGQSEIKGVVIV